jgi:uncharacterized MAPEG superfamily protein
MPLVAGLVAAVFKDMTEGAQDPHSGMMGPRLRIQSKVNQSHLEHLIWFAFPLLAVSTRLNPNEMRLLPILTGVFIAARLLYWLSYTLGGALSRAPAGQVSLTLNVGLFLGTIALFTIRGVQ